MMQRHHLPLLFCFLLLLLISTTLANDYYNILGVSRTATEQEIKSAYKKLAVKWHPDKNGNNPDAQKKFIEISKAYEVLKDAEKRKRYDRYGDLGEGNGGSEQHQHHGHGQGAQHFNFHFGGAEFDPFEMFRDFFEEDEGMRHHGHRGHRGHRGNYKAQEDGNLVPPIGMRDYSAVLNGEHLNSHHPWLLFLNRPTNQLLYCHACYQLNQIMDAVMKDLTSDKHFHVHKIAVQSSSMLPSGVYELPSIICVMNGHISIYPSNVFALSRINDFVHECMLSAAPSVEYYVEEGQVVEGAIHVIETEAQFKDFVNPKAATAVEKALTGQTSVILFSAKEEPTIAEREAAYLFEGLTKFAHVHVPAGKPHWMHSIPQAAGAKLPALMVRNNYLKSADAATKFYQGVGKQKLFEVMASAVSLPVLRSTKMLHQFCATPSGCVLYSHEAFNNKTAAIKDTSFALAQSHIQALSQLSSSKVGLVVNYEELRDFFVSLKRKSGSTKYNDADKMSFLLVKIKPEESSFTMYTAAASHEIALKRWIESEQQSWEYQKYKREDLPSLDLSYEAAHGGFWSKAPFRLLYKLYKAIAASAAGVLEYPLLNIRMEVNGQEGYYPAMTVSTALKLLAFFGIMYLFFWRCLKCCCRCCCCCWLFDSKDQEAELKQNKKKKPTPTATADSSSSKRKED